MAGDGKERPANVAAKGAEAIIAEVRALRGNEIFSGATNRALTRIENTAQNIYDENAQQDATTGRRERKPTPVDTGRKRKK